MMIKTILKMILMISSISEMISFGGGVIPGGPRDPVGEHLYLPFTPEPSSSSSSPSSSLQPAGMFFGKYSTTAIFLKKIHLVKFCWEGRTPEEALFWQLHMQSRLSTQVFLVFRFSFCIVCLSLCLTVSVSLCLSCRYMQCAALLKLGQEQVRCCQQA